jgi:hypothetical protein
VRLRFFFFLRSVSMTELELDMHLLRLPVVVLRTDENPGCDFAGMLLQNAGDAKYRLWMPFIAE